jgi:dihydrofolate reductase
MSQSRVAELKMIVALCRGGGIGYEGKLPWPKLARDLRFFSEMTRSSVFPYNSAVVMGRKTWESIPDNARPLPFRDNFVISASAAASAHEGASEPMPGVTFINSLSDIHKYTMNYDQVWLIGGASIYEQVLAAPSSSFPVNDIYITFVDEEYEYDAAFPLAFQYASVEEWEARKNDLPNRAIWCWTDAESMPKYISFFVNNTRLYHLTYVDRDIVSSITRPSDLKAIQERRAPDTLFVLARSACVRPHTTGPKRE